MLAESWQLDPCFRAFAAPSIRLLDRSLPVPLSRSEPVLITLLTLPRSQHKHLYVQWRMLKVDTALPLALFHPMLHSFTPTLFNCYTSLT